MLLRDFLRIVLVATLLTCGLSALIVLHVPINFTGAVAPTTLPRGGAIGFCMMLWLLLMQWQRMLQSTHSSDHTKNARAAATAHSPSRLRHVIL